MTQKFCDLCNQPMRETRKFLRLMLKTRHTLFLQKGEVITMYRNYVPGPFGVNSAPLTLYTHPNTTEDICNTCLEKAILEAVKQLRKEKPQ